MIGFYSGVHLVAGYCWETHTFELRSHREVRQEVRRHFSAAIRASCKRLADIARQARYLPDYRISVPDARDLLDNDLGALRQAVRTDPAMTP